MVRCCRGVGYQYVEFSGTFEVDVMIGDLGCFGLLREALLDWGG